MFAVPKDFQKDIDLATQILKSHGCQEIYVFGSIAEGSFSADSDIDFAVVGLSKSLFFRAYGELLSGLSHRFDLVGLDYDNDFSRHIKETAKFERVA